MKKLSFLFLALILLLTGCSKKSTFTLKGNISSLSSDTILVFYQEPNYKLDTIIAQNGKFSYTINSDTFTIFSLLLSDKEVLPVFANKGESVTWNGTPGDIQIKGKGDNERMAYILQAIKKTKADSLMFTVDRLIKENPHSFANIYLIEQYYVQDSLPDYSRIDELIQGLSGSIKDTPYMIDLQAKLKEKKELNRQSQVHPSRFLGKLGQSEHGGTRFTGQRTEGIEKREVPHCQPVTGLGQERMVEGLRQRHHPVETSM